jgi:hypothetical protein
VTAIQPAHTARPATPRHPDRRTVGATNAPRQAAAPPSRRLPRQRAATPDASTTAGPERPMRIADLDQVSDALGGLLLVGDLHDLPDAVPVGWTIRRSIIWSLPIRAGLCAEAALRLTQRHGIRAICMVGSHSLPYRRAVASTYAAHLTVARTGRDLPGPWITAEDPPAVPDGALRLPHFVTVNGPANTEDLVVWELMTAGTARRWLGEPLPDPSFVEQHLTDVLQLRAAVRARRLPHTPPGRRLAVLLQHRRLSIRLIYQHHSLFTELLTSR